MQRVKFAELCVSVCAQLLLEVLGVWMNRKWRALCEEPSRHLLLPVGVCSLPQGEIPLLEPVSRWAAGGILSYLARRDHQWYHGGELCLPVPALVARGSAEGLVGTHQLWGSVSDPSPSNPSKADGVKQSTLTWVFRLVFKKKKQKTQTKKPTNKQIMLSAIKQGEKYFDFNDAVHVSNPLMWD